MSPYKEYVGEQPQITVKYRHGLMGRLKRRWQRLTIWVQGSWRQRYKRCPECGKPVGPAIGWSASIRAWLNHWAESPDCDPDNYEECEICGEKFRQFPMAGKSQCCCRSCFMTTCKMMIDDVERTMEKNKSVIVDLEDVLCEHDNDTRKRH